MRERLRGLWDDALLVIGSVPIVFLGVYGIAGPDSPGFGVAYPIAIACAIVCIAGRLLERLRAGGGEAQRR